MARLAIRKPTTGANTIRTAHLSRTTQISITRTVIHNRTDITRIGIRSRTSRTGMPTPGLTRLIVTTHIGTANGIEATGSG